MKLRFTILTAALCAAPVISASAESIVNPLGMKFVSVPPGEFNRTTKKWDRAKRGYRTDVWFKVRVTRGFQMQTTEVTQGQWKRVMGKLPYIWTKKGPNLPVTMVSHKDIQNFIRKLNALDSGATYRLPYHVEWEYMAKGSRTFFHWGDDFNGRFMVHYGNSGRKPARVASKRPNRLGIHDLWGNVWEWTQSSHNFDHYERLIGRRGEGDCRSYQDVFCFPRGHVLTDPRGVPGPFFRIIGYSYASSKNSCGSSGIRAYAPDYKDYRLGFRLIRVPVGGDEPPRVDPAPIDKPKSYDASLNLPLLRAAYEGRANRVRGLLARRANPDATDRGWTSLMYAAWFGHYEVARVLLEKGADTGISTKDGWSAAQLAQYKQNRRMQNLIRKYSGNRVPIRKRGFVRSPRRPR